MQELKGKKLVLFGAGRSGEIFAEHAKGLEVLAFADNDVKKQGQQLMGFPIIAPERIAESGCEVIVVTTVCPTQRIVEQLISLGLGDIPLITPDKAVLKGTQNHPFSHPLTKQIARELIVALDELASRAGVDLYLDYGTLLGAFREQDFIAWDDDIDMSVKDEQLDALLVLVQKDKSWLPQYPGVEWSVQVVTAGAHRLGVLIAFDNAPGERCVLPLELAVTNRVVRDGQSVMSGKMLEFFCPASFFDGHDTVEFFGRRFKTPVNPTGYLDFIYGDWRKPKQNMSFSEYQGIREVPQDQVEEINYQKL
ncbi:hypothetical protein AU05_18405 [Ectopseudomonas composti]|uniref:LicD/FKTN/FKRP nucleotidyltransferase domain-containing protein n=1 Tax=Ectopseudomonas composti TaxID=658457 RepID=A0ABN0SA61_9GAMM|nr:LicD family protein [Pseudomonas composti]EZH79084.1 hypothetical protein AU05_18405 [Pseudomonas composti]